MMDRGTELALKRAVREGLATRLQGDFDPVEVESVIQSLVQEAVRAWNLGLAEPDVARLCRSVGDDFLRFGPLQGLLEDPGITEIIVNGGGVAMDAGVARFLAFGSMMPTISVASSTRSPSRRACAAMRRMPWAAPCCRVARREQLTSCLRLPRTVPRSTFACSAMTS